MVLCTENEKNCAESNLFVQNSSQFSCNGCVLKGSKDIHLEYTCREWAASEPWKWHAKNVAICDSYELVDREKNPAYDVHTRFNTVEETCFSYKLRTLYQKSVMWVTVSADLPRSVWSLD